MANKLPFLHKGTIHSLTLLLQLSLFFDVLLPMTTGLSESDFISGERSGTFGKPMSKENGNNRTNMVQARKLLWKELHGYRMRTCESGVEKWRGWVLDGPGNRNIYGQRLMDGLLSSTIEKQVILAPFSLYIH